MEAVSADKAGSATKDFLDNVGTIEVVVLRCKAPTQVTSADNAQVSTRNNEGKGIKQTTHKQPEKSKPASAKAGSVSNASRAQSSIGGLMGLFDGAADYNFDGPADVPTATLQDLQALLTQMQNLQQGATAPPAGGIPQVQTILSGQTNAVPQQPGYRAPSVTGDPRYAGLYGADRREMKERLRARGEAVSVTDFGNGAYAYPTQPRQQRSPYGQAPGGFSAYVPQTQGGAEQAIAAEVAAVQALMEQLGSQKQAAKSAFTMVEDPVVLQANGERGNKVASNAWETKSVSKKQEEKKATSINGWSTGNSKAAGNNGWDTGSKKVDNQNGWDSGSNKPAGNADWGHVSNKPVSIANWGSASNKVAGGNGWEEAKPVSVSYNDWKKKEQQQQQQKPSSAKNEWDTSNKSQGWGDEKAASQKANDDAVWGDFKSYNGSGKSEAAKSHPHRSRRPHKEDGTQNKVDDWAKQQQNVTGNAWDTINKNNTSGNTWDDTTSIKLHKNDNNWDTSKNKQPSVHQQSQKAQERILKNGSSTYVKPYWAHWDRNPPAPIEPAPPPQGPKNLYTHRAGPLPAVPASTAKQRDLAAQVRVGAGADYYHRTSRPEYLDEMVKPYAVFTFRYRSKEFVESKLGIKVEEVEESGEDVRKMTKEELIKEVLRARGVKVREGAGEKGKGKEKGKEKERTSDVVWN